jgi:hypothetical protein
VFALINGLVYLGTSFVMFRKLKPSTRQPTEYYEPVEDDYYYGDEPEMEDADQVQSPTVPKTEATATPAVVA